MEASFENLFLIWLAGIIIGVTGAMIPGPLTLFIVSAVLKTNRFSALKGVLGHILLELVFIGLILLGLQKFFSSQNFILTVSIVGQRPW